MLRIAPNSPISAILGALGVILYHYQQFTSVSETTSGGEKGRNRFPEKVCV
ncbi:DEHA2D14146p [Debaryomyces hansenii CBS767]|uniref:DEHA2D14146p n=1 Tax=Debaryomyces hansenii (strain ATCC 36239 / CBS 767 / BCRC 21394 / JCM 1990 / NBRC 0083 / IGC 2968) TaxID=284592 RepID=Q6BRS7_DEBHA|nr:DEHA2D14146p [Debaryomyces hansenii CBS767]CAG87261.2 DEHA2D14146p [Debaryomyces hansenii CBS767]|eukprot:XP_459093.2 DEHA2D14146p [Debaryomyces hansenii CBS767]